jgi:cytochrome c-type biogenesis protein CcmH
MILFLLLALMIAASALLLAPLLRDYEKRRSAFAGEARVFRNQVKEVEREATDGGIDTERMVTTRLQIRRRLFGSARAPKTLLPRLSPVEQNRAVVAMVVIVSLGSLSLYNGKVVPALSSSSELGSPTTPAASDALLRIAANIGDGLPEPRRAAAELATLSAMIAVLVERLRQAPNSANSWRLLGWCYAKTGRFSEAASAYAKAIELRPDIASPLDRP